jgi:hypothetical protein
VAARARFTAGAVEKGSEVGFARSTLDRYALYLRKPAQRLDGASRRFRQLVVEKRPVKRSTAADSNTRSSPSSDSSETKRSPTSLYRCRADKPSA